MATELETLLIRVEADTRRLRTNMERAERQMQKTAGNMSKSMGRFDLAISKSTAGLGKLKGALGVAIPAVTILALGKLADNALTAADKIAKVADKVGLTTDQLQELRFAADQSGVGTDKLDMAMQRFSRRVGEAAQGSGELYDTLKQYNIGVLDANGGTRANIDILNDLANAIKGAKSQQEALRIAFKAFDSEGAALVNLLRGGSDGLDKMRAEAQRLGIVMDAELVRKGEEARSKLDALGNVLQAKLNIALVNAAPLLEKTGGLLTGMAAGALEAATNLAKFLGVLDRSTAEQLAAVEKRLADLKRLSGSVGVGGATVDAKTIKELEAQRDALQKILGSNLGKTFFDTTSSKVGFGGPSKLPPKKGASTTDKAGDFVADVERRVAALVKEREGLSLTGAALEAFTFKQRVQAEQYKLGDQLTAAQAARLEELTEKYRVAAIENERLAQELERSREAMQALNGLIDESAGGALDALNQALSGNKSAWADWGRSILQTLQKLIFQLAVVNVLKNLLGFKAPGGGAFTTLWDAFGGKRESGGPVSAGKTYMVGEKGPELFQPSMSGRIVPNNKMGGGGATYYVDATGASRAEFERFKAWVTARDGRVEERAVKAVLSRNARTLGAA